MAQKNETRELDRILDDLAEHGYGLTLSSYEGQKDPTGTRADLMMVIDEILRPASQDPNVPMALREESFRAEQRIYGH